MPTLSRIERDSVQKLESQTSFLARILVQKRLTDRDGWSVSLILQHALVSLTDERRLFDLIIFVSDFRDGHSSFTESLHDGVRAHHVRAVRRVHGRRQRRPSRVPVLPRRHHVRPYVRGTLLLGR